MAHLLGRHILVVEDQALIAFEVAAMIESEGGLVVGPCPTLATALVSAEAPKLDAAVLDVNLGLETSLPVARRLNLRSVPFVFYTGQLKRDFFEEWPTVPVILKPAADLIVASLSQLMHRTPLS